MLIALNPKRNLIMDIFCVNKLTDAAVALLQNLESESEWLYENNIQKWLKWKCVRKMTKQCQNIRRTFFIECDCLLSHNPRITTELKMSGLVCALIATTITVLLTKYLFISSFSCCSVSRTSLISLQIWHFSQLKHLNRFSSCDKTVRHRWTTWKIFFARFTSQKEKKNNNQRIGYSSHFKRISFCFCNESMKTRNKTKTNKPFSSGATSRLSRSFDHCAASLSFHLSLVCNCCSKPSICPKNWVFVLGPSTYDTLLAHFSFSNVVNAFVWLNWFSICSCTLFIQANARIRSATLSSSGWTTYGEHS